MGLCGVPYAVDTFHDGVHCCVVSYGVVCAIEVIVYGSRQTDAADVELLCELHCAGQRAVTTNDNEGVDTFLHEVLIGFLLSLVSKEFL